MSSTSTQNPNVFQMSLGFKQVSEDLTKETECGGGSVLTLQWLPQVLSVIGLGTCHNSFRELLCLHCHCPREARFCGASLGCVVQLSYEPEQEMA